MERCRMKRDICSIFIVWVFYDKPEQKYHPSFGKWTEWNVHITTFCLLLK